MEIKWLISHPTVLLPWGKKKPQYQLNRRLDGSQSGYGRLGRKKNLLALPTFEPQTVQPVA
jgi:hypothetical protein